MTLSRPTPIAAAMKSDQGELGDRAAGVADADREQFAGATVA